jgi:hypothetical protein
MIKLPQRPQAPPESASQMSIAFTTGRLLEPERRAAVVALLSQLLLEVARAERGEDEADERS